MGSTHYLFDPDSPNPDPNTTFWLNRDPGFYDQRLYKFKLKKFKYIILQASREHI